ncbi:MAG: UDP-N-acetylmuramoyl-L-alanine--D-glutamate ligase [Actinomycetota bacterium]|nr:UDP-N-acetylmuramoyl-L-alanine--D-glutamate ligase [Actinomycetota bacterium]
MRWSDLDGRRLAIWGTGREGIAAARVAFGRGIEPVLVDDDPVAGGARASALLGPAVGVVPPDDPSVRRAEVIIRSPGVSRYRPELAAARERGVVVTTAMALWLDEHRDRPVLAVTGTKGKSTTAAMAAAILEAAGVPVALAGNIGRPVTEVSPTDPAEVFVVEVSSYQAAEVTTSPRVTVLTSLAPDHLDWHGGVEAYYRDKLALIATPPFGALAVNGESTVALDRTAGHPDRTVFGPGGRVRVEDGQVVVDGTALASVSGLRVPGAHNVTNLLGAVTGVLLVTGNAPPGAAVSRVVREFRGLPSRCEHVVTVDGVEFVDDALASNPFATATSVLAYPGRPLTVILGGSDRGVDLGELAGVMARLRPPPRLVVMPPDGDRFDVLGGGSSPLPVRVDDLEAAVAGAFEVTPAGGVVLFSPAAPTPPGQGGYQERSRRYRAAIAGLAGR